MFERCCHYAAADIFAARLRRRYDAFTPDYFTTPLRLRQDAPRRVVTPMAMPRRLCYAVSARRYERRTRVSY